MRIIDPKMGKLMDKALKLGDNLFNLDDIQECLKNGKMQGHVEGDTWVITQVHEWPRRKSVNILYVVGSLGNALAIEDKLIDWAKSIDADLITTVAREGWGKFVTPGWKKIGTLYSKDI